MTGDFGDFEPTDSTPLGVGSTGQVYRARQKSVPRAAALKVIDRRLADPAVAPALDARYRREIEILATIRHPNVVAVYGSGISGDRPWTAMEFLEGGTLEAEIARRIKERQTFAPAEIARLGIGTAKGLAEGLRHGVVHRDLKPSNILFDRDRNPVVTDFGLAKLVGKPSEGADRLTGAGDILGTPAFMAPEAVLPGAGSEPDHRADIYSLGAVLYNMAALCPPFSGRNSYEVMSRHVSQEPDPIRRIHPGCPAQLEALILRCLAKDPAKRFQDYGEIIETLDRFTADNSPTNSFWSRYRVGAAILVLALAALIPAGFAWFPRMRSDLRRDSSGTTRTTENSKTPSKPEVPERSAKKDEPEPTTANKNEETDSKASKEISLRDRIAGHVLQAEEAGFLRKVSAYFLSEDASLREMRFDELRKKIEERNADPAQTPYTRLHVDESLSMLAEAQALADARWNVLRKTGTRTMVRLRDGTSSNGIVDASDGTTVSLRTEDGKVIAFRREDLSVEDVASQDAHGQAGMLLRGLSGDSWAVLPDVLRLADGVDRCILWLPVFLDLGFKRAALLAALDSAKAKIGFEASLAVEREILGYHPHLKARFDQMRSEVAALDFLAAGDWPAILVGYFRTASGPLAEIRLLEGSRSLWKEDLLADERWNHDWEMRPSERTPSETVKHWRYDHPSKAVLLRDLSERRSLVRKSAVATASEGMQVEFLCDLDQEGSSMHVTMASAAGDGRLLRIDKGSVRLVRQAMKDGKEDLLAQGVLPSSETGWRVLTLLSAGGHLFAFFDGKLVLHAPVSEAMLVPFFAIAVERSSLWLRSMKVRPLADSRK